MKNHKIQTGRSMIENFSTKFVNFATGLVVKCKNLRKVCRVELLDANQNSLHRGNALASDSQKKSYFNSNRRLNNTQAGRSMIEMLGVLAIMAVITVLSIMAYTMAMKNVKVNRALSDVALMNFQIKTICPNGDYTNLQGKTYKSLFVDTGLMKSSNAFGSGNDTAPGYLVRAGGGGPDTAKMDRFLITVGDSAYQGLTQSECRLFATTTIPGAIRTACQNLRGGANTWYVEITMQ